MGVGSSHGVYELGLTLATHKVFVRDGPRDFERQVADAGMEQAECGAACHSIVGIYADAFRGSIRRTGTLEPKVAKRVQRGINPRCLANAAEARAPEASANRVGGALFCLPG